MAFTPVTWIITALMLLGFLVNLMIFWFKKEEMNPLQMVYSLSVQLFVFIVLITILVSYLYRQGIIN